MTTNAERMNKHMSNPIYKCKLAIFIKTTCFINNKKKTLSKFC